MKTLTFIVALLVSAPTFALPRAADFRTANPGAKVYEEVCQACHMANAMGAEGAGRITALANNPNLESADYPIAIVTGGKGPMPWFRGQMTDQQIADVINYVRSSFGNTYTDRITAADVNERGVKAPTRGER